MNQWQLIRWGTDHIDRVELIFEAVRDRRTAKTLAERSKIVAELATQLGGELDDIEATKAAMDDDPKQPVMAAFMKAFESSAHFEIPGSIDDWLIDGARMLNGIAN